MIQQRKPREFTDALAVRDVVPLLIGLMGPSGGGKTYSALRLATGMQKVTGGDIFGIDTESKRMKHYAQLFRFQHVPFNAPYGSLDYLDALRYARDRGAKVIIVDSMSHEHEGEGGLLDAQDAEMRRLAGDSYGTRAAERFNLMAWQKPKRDRRKLIEGILHMGEDINFIFCFRAKRSTKPKKVQQSDGGFRTEMVDMGFMPIAGEELVFEMTLNALLMPGAEGVPTWRSDQIGERMMMKLPEQFKALGNVGKPFDEAMGQRFAEWARGTEKPPKTNGQAAAPAESTPQDGLFPTLPDNPEPEDFDPLTWASDQHRRLESMESEAQIDTMLNEEHAHRHFKMLEAESPAMAKALDAAIRGKRKALADRERADT